MKCFNTLVVFGIILTLLSCQSGDNQTTRGKSVSVQESAQAKKQLEEQGIEVSEAAILEKAEKGETEIVSLLLKAGVSADVTHKQSGVTPIMVATNWGHVDVVKRLIDAGAKLNMKDIMGDTALTRAAALNKKGIAVALLNAGADINLKGARGRTPLMIAATHRNFEILDLLIQAGAKLDIKDDKGKTALMLVEESGSSDIAKILSEAEASKK